MGLVKLNKAITFQFEPGDGTRYTCVVGPWGESDIYLGIGPGQQITIASSLTRTSFFQFAQDLKYTLSHMSSDIPQYDMVMSIWNHHLTKLWLRQQYKKDQNPYTVVVGLLIGMISLVYDGGDLLEDVVANGLHLIELMYTGNYQEAATLMESWGV